MSDTAQVVELWETGRIKWFDPSRRYGWIVPDDDGDDIFFRWLLAQEYGIKESLLRPGVRVLFKWRTPTEAGRRPQAFALKLIRG